MRKHFKPGDWVIYRKQKYSVRPSPHARSVHPAPLGDHYYYEIDKYWIVVAIEADQSLVLRTRRGKQVKVNTDDPALRRAHWWERLWFRRRFPAVTMPEAPKTRT
jgi:hypothetical protein